MVDKLKFVKEFNRLFSERNTEDKVEKENKLNKLIKENKPILYLTKDWVVGVVFFNKELERLFREVFDFDFKEYEFDKDIIGDEIGFTLVPEEYFNICWKILYNLSNDISILTTKNEPIFLKGEDFMFLLAPRLNS